LHFVVTVQTFAPCVQDLQQEIHHSVMHFANFVQTFVMLVLLNVKNFQHTIVVKSVPKLAENVLLSAAKCNQLFFPIAESPLRDFAQGKNKKLNNGYVRCRPIQMQHDDGLDAITPKCDEVNAGYALME